MEQKKYWVGFNLVKGIGSVRLTAILDYFGDLQIAWNAPADALRSAGLSSRVVENLLKLRREVDLDKIWENLIGQGIQVVTWSDENYPRRLKEIEQPPPVLYIRGSISEEDALAVAIVGTRRITAYGRQVSAELATFLAQHGITVVSGLARGVDSIAHSAAIQAGGRTLAVLGSGVDRIYPPEHRGLAEKLIGQGALISDYAVGTPPDSVNFPPRNRIISGLSLATVVVEAGDTSGALITANFAADQGRDVVAVPGPIYAPQSKGPNRLIQAGARPLLKMEDILDVLQIENAEEKREARRLLPADAQEASMLQILSANPQHVDEICMRSGLSIDKVSATLAMMELKGMIRQVGGMNYVAIQEAKSSYGSNDND